MVKIPISRDKSRKRVASRPNNGSFNDIKKPTEYKRVKPKSKRPKIKINFDKLLSVSITVVILIILIVVGYKYIDYRKVKKEEGEKAQLNREIEEKKQEIIKENIQEEVKEEIQKEMVLIKDTETGYLNVREGAGTNYPILTKVYPGESYVLLEEVEEWYKIELSDEKQGWIFKEYAIKQ